jgi:hypothetical protein
MAIESLLAQAERCHKEVAMEFYNAFSGRQDKLDISAIVDRYPELYTRETLDTVVSLDESDIHDERERRFLRLVFTSNYITGRLKQHTDQLANTESEAVVRVDEQEIPYRALPLVLAKETDYDKRGRLDNAYIQTLAGINPLREEADGLYRSIVQELGYANTIGMVEQLAQMRVYPMRDLLKQFLSDTSDVYEERLTNYAAESELERDQLRHADIGFLMRAGRFDELFPPAEMVPALSRTLKGLGIDLDC